MKKDILNKKENRDLILTALHSLRNTFRSSHSINDIKQVNKTTHLINNIKDYENN